MRIPSITDVDVRGRRVLVRADLNVPMEDGRVTDTTRIDRFAAGMKPLLRKGARLVILTHFGRPAPHELDPAFSVDKLRPDLANALGTPVQFSDVCADTSAQILSKSLKDGEVLLCENLRYNTGETENDMAFAAQLAKLGDIYVNDAFSSSRRCHASVEALAHIMPAYGGPLLIEEVTALSAVMEDPRHPEAAIVGGGKVSNKVAVLKNLVPRLDHLILGGGVANTFLAAKGAPMGKSLYEADQLAAARDILALAEASGCQVHLPADVVAAKAFKPYADHSVVAAEACPPDGMILDVGPEAIADFRAVLQKCKTILWYGPLGAYQKRPFDSATLELADCAADLTQTGQAITVAGGKGTVAALNRAGVTKDFTYVSAAGGAFLEWLEGKMLPGIAALEDAAKAA
ncbi:MAG: phosphoglycerate kinase [Marinibacterium sp.]